MTNIIMEASAGLHKLQQWVHMFLCHPKKDGYLYIVRMAIKHIPWLDPPFLFGWSNMCPVVQIGSGSSSFPLPDLSSLSMSLSDDLIHVLFFTLCLCLAFTPCCLAFTPCCFV